MAEYGNTVDSFKKFLADFSTRDAPTEESPLPFRLQSYLLTEDEIDGEVIDWCFLVLEQLHCPDFLKFSLAREVVKSVNSAGLDRYKQEREVENEDDAVYFVAMSLARSTFVRLHNVCIKWNEQLPDFSLPHLASYSVCGIKNTRRKMEDKHTVIPDLNTLLELKDQPQTQYYAVFDGHGGLDASAYAARQLHLRIAEHSSFAKDMEDTLKTCLLDLDNEYCKKSKRESLRSGTTAVVAVIRESVLTLAWIGDSQAVLVRDGKPITLMEPHKPDREDEKQRIEGLGGCVIWFGAWRVNGTLSVSRAIGDADHKPYVCGDADTSRTDLDGSEDYLCLACDGFWDVFNGEQLAELVSQHLKETGDQQTLARTLCVKAKEAGSSDNITVLIVFLWDNITLVDSQNGEKEAGTNEAGEGNPKDENQDTKENPNVNNSKNATDETSKENAPPEGSVMVQGSKLEPTVKETPTHRVFMNKLQSLNPKVSVIVTESSPHAKMPCSVVTHKSPWQSPQVSPVMRRRDTRGSLISLGPIDNEETTTRNLWMRDSQPNMMLSNTHGFFPALVPDKKSQNRVNATSPSPSCISEPSVSGSKLSGNGNMHYPTKPNTQRQSRGRVPYRTSIINASHAEEISHLNRLNDMYRRRRGSLSVPMHNSRMSEMYVPPSRPQSLSQDSNSQRRYGTNFLRRVTIAEGVGEIHRDNTAQLGVSTQHGTNIAITNSFVNKLQPRKSKERKFAAIYGVHHSPVPIKALYRRQRSRSAL